MKNSNNMKRGIKFGALLFSLAAFSANSQTVVNFPYTGAVQNWVVPPCVTTISIFAEGGEGGGITAADKGKAAQITGTIPVTPGQVLEIRVGGAGAITAGGYNGGGLGGTATLVSDRSGGGGGASDVRVAPYALGNRVIVAGAGGGYGGGDTDADGGDALCPNGQNGANSWGIGGGGGTTVSGGTAGSPWGGGSWGSPGALGVGGAAGLDICYSRGPGGAGGGGLYGGGGGGSDCWAGGGSYGGGGGAAGSSLIPAGGACVPNIGTADGLVTITYTPAAPIGGDASAVPTTICDGETVDLTLTGYFGTSIQWESAPTSAGPFAPTSAADTLDTWTTGPLSADVCYRVAVVGCGMTVYSDTVCITVNPLPTVDAGMPVTVCDGDNVTLTAFNPDGAALGWSGGVTDGVPFVPPFATTTTYTVTATLLGCVSTDDVDVTSNPYPVVSAGPDAQICLGDPFTLTAINPDGAIISWDLGVTDGVPFTPAGVGVVGHTVSADLLGCISTDMMNLTVNGLPTINAGSDVNVCQGVLVTLSGSGAGPGGSYAWDGGVVDGNPFLPPAGVTTTYTCTGTDANGCVGTDQVDVVIISNPTVIITPSDTTGCEPFKVDFLDMSVPSGIDCVWDFGDGSTSAGCGTASHEFLNDGDYTVTLTVTIPGGCVGSGTAMVHVIPYPVAQFSMNTSEVNIEDSRIMFDNSSLDATEYSWDFGDESPMSTEEDPTHEFPDVPNKEYTVTLIAANAMGCADTLSKLIFVHDVITFYVPNTFTPDGDAHNDMFQPMFYSGFDPYDFNMKIYNRWGEVVFETYDATKGWDGTYGDRGLVEDGTYVWFIEFAETMSDKRHKHRGHVTILK
jgi:gliding motility-associated-like protein